MSMSMRHLFDGAQIEYGLLPIATPPAPVISGTATGGSTSNGSATGTRVVGGTATGPALPGNGAASGTRVVQGSVSGSSSTAGSATGIRSVSGTAAGSSSSEASATGLRVILGTAVGPSGSSGSASGLRAVGGTAASSQVSAGMAAGTRVVLGSANGGSNSTGGASTGLRLVSGVGTGAAASGGSAIGSRITFRTIEVALSPGVVFSRIATAIRSIEEDPGLPVVELAYVLAFALIEMPPVATITSVSGEAMSRVEGYDSIEIEFEFDVPVVSWAVRVGSTSAFDGFLAQSYNGEPVTTGSASIHQSALLGRSNDVDVYGRGVQGSWSLKSA